MTCKQGVLHKRADGHGTYAAGNGSDETALGGNLVKLDIAAQTESALLCGIGYTGGAYVYDYGALLDHIGLDETGLAKGGYYDIGLEALLLDVCGVTVAYGHGAVTRVGFLHQQAGHGLAHYVAAAQYHGFLAAGLDVVALEQFHDAVGRGRYEAWQTDAHAAYVDGMESVHILAVINGLYYMLLIDMLGQRQLDYESVHIRVIVELGNFVEEDFLCYVTLKTDKG